MYIPPSMILKQLNQNHIELNATHRLYPFTYRAICDSSDTHASTPANVHPRDRKLLSITSPNRSRMFTCS